MSSTSFFKGNSFLQASKITDSSGENVVLMLGRCLPHIVPNVILAKREVCNSLNIFIGLKYVNFCVGIFVF